MSKTKLPKRHSKGVRQESLATIDGTAIRQVRQFFHRPALFAGTSALALMRRCLDRFRIEGVRTTVPLLADVVSEPAFVDAPVTTRWLEEEFLERWTGRTAAAFDAQHSTH